MPSEEQLTQAAEGWTPQKEYEGYREAKQHIDQSIDKVRQLVSQARNAGEAAEFVIRECQAVEKLIHQIAHNTQDARCKEEAERAEWSVRLIRQRTEADHTPGIAAGLERALAILEGPADDEE